MLLNTLQKVVSENRDRVSPPALRNLLKEVLQLYTLNFIYNSKYGKTFLFKGGTCLRFCFDLPRLSEDLDFDVKNWENFSLSNFVKDINSYFFGSLQFRDFRTKIAGNKREIFLQFSVMKKLGLGQGGGSDILFLRIDLSPVDSLFYKEEISVKSTGDFSFIINRYCLEDLFASKIAAILSRTFKKGKGDLVTFKGRDYFDLVWFLEKRAAPNWKRVVDITGTRKKEEVVKRLNEKVSLVKGEYLREDLLPLFKNADFVENFVVNFKKIYKNYQLSSL